jgi:hypothetical protein
MNIIEKPFPSFSRRPRLAIAVFESLSLAFQVTISFLLDILEEQKFGPRQVRK